MSDMQPNEPGYYDEPCKHCGKWPTDDSKMRFTWPPPTEPGIYWAIHPKYPERKPIPTTVFYFTPNLLQAIYDTWGSRNVEDLLWGYRIDVPEVAND